MIEALDVLVTTFLSLFRNYAFPEMCAAYLLSFRGKRDYQDYGRFGVQDDSSDGDSRAGGDEGIESIDDYSVSSVQEMIEILEAEEMNECDNGSGQSVKRSKKAKEDFEKLEKISLDNKLKFPILMRNSLKLAAKSMHTLGIIYERTEGYYYDTLCKWLKEPNEEDLCAYDPYSAEEHNVSWRFWCDRMSLSCFEEDTYGEWHDFADLARRYVSAAASEAFVERLLSKQRAIHGEHITRIEPETITARLTLYEPSEGFDHPELRNEHSAVFLDLIAG